MMPHEHSAPVDTLLERMIAYMPHGHCLTWEPLLLWPTVAGDAVTAAAYMSLSATLLYVQKRDLVPTTPRIEWLLRVFAVFIFLCGCTHISAIVTIWVGSYWTHMVLVASTGVVSALVAILVLVEVVSLCRRARAQCVVQKNG